MKRTNIQNIIVAMKNEGVTLKELEAVILDTYGVKATEVKATPAQPKAEKKADKPAKQAPTKGYVVTFEGGFPKDVMPTLTALGGEYSKEYKGFVCKTKKVAEAVAKATVTVEARLQVRRTWKNFKKGAKCTEWVGNGTVTKLGK